MRLSTLSAEQIKLLPTENDIQLYRERGYYISGKILPDDILDAAISGSKLLYEGKLNKPSPITGTDSWKPGDSDRVLRKNDFSSFQRRELADIVNFPLLGAIAALLCGEPVRLWHDQLLYKPTNDTKSLANVGWHTDRQYWQCCSSKEMLTAWVPFRDVGIAEGSITFLESSNHWSSKISGLNFREQDHDKLARNFTSETDTVKKVTAELEKGQVTFHHCMTIHGSGPNTSNLPRQSLAVHIQPASNRWRKYEYKMPDGTIKYHDIESLVRKKNDIPDFTDPEICPLLWPKDGAGEFHKS